MNIGSKIICKTKKWSNPFFVFWSSHFFFIFPTFFLDGEYPFWLILNPRKSISFLHTCILFGSMVGLCCMRVCNTSYNREAICSAECVVKMTSSIKYPISLLLNSPSTFSIDSAKIVLLTFKPNGKRTGKYFSFRLWKLIYTYPDPETVNFSKKSTVQV